VFRDAFLIDQRFVIIIILGWGFRHIFSVQTFLTKRAATFVIGLNQGKSDTWYRHFDLNTLGWRQRGFRSWPVVAGTCPLNGSHPVRQTHT
jgi:hypothetical protein